MVSSGKYERECAYWLSRLSGELPVSGFFIETGNQTAAGSQWENRRFEFPPALYKRMKQMCHATPQALFVLLTAGISALLAKYSGNNDIIIGAPVLKQEMEGPFFNCFLLLRNCIGGNRPVFFKDLVMDVKQTIIDAYMNQNYPFTDDACASFDTFVQMKELHEEIDFAGKKCGTVFSFSMNNDTLHCDLDYDSTRLEPAAVEQLNRHLLNFFEAALNPHRSLEKIDILSPQEKRQLLDEFNSTVKDFPTGKTIHGLFEEQAQRTPDCMAVIGLSSIAVEAIHESPLHPTENECIQITYRQLNEQSGRMADYLYQKGIRPGDIAAIIMERSLEMVIAIFAILKTGAAYLPIDPEYPQERIDYIISDSSARICLKDLNHEEHEEHEQVFPFLLTETPAYLIYTSGSTGNPKGVLVEHGSVVNILYGLQQLYPFEAEDTYLFKTSYLFDVSVTELFGWYFCGGRMSVLASGAEKDPQQIIRTINQHRVTHVNFVPSMFSAFLEELQRSQQMFEELSALRYIFLAGEALAPALVEKFKQLDPDQGIRLENIYGPTEGTIYSSYYPLSQWQMDHSVPIGKPLSNIVLYILDPHLQLQPVGVPGELYIGGAGVARGYLNRPELTAERFVTLDRSYKSDTSYRTYYKTGDLALWQPDGNIRFLGRIDTQVKVRGFRVEPGEIEARLLRHEHVREAVVLAKTSTGQPEEKYLCAYVAGEHLQADRLREYLAGTLPHYMVPAHFVVLESIPLTPGGKVDRQALLKHKETRAGSRATYVAPGSPVEQQIVAVWQEVLQLENIGVHDNFFDLGGNSFDIMKINSRLQTLLEKEIPVVKMFKYPTIRTLASYLDQGEIRPDAVQETQKMVEKKDRGKNRLKERTRRGRGGPEGKKERR
jgi:amino acid adenylation domain-containing protein